VNVTSSNLPRLCLRADATPQIGLGHVMRSLALAQAWQRAGGKATLAGHWPALAELELAVAYGIELHPLDRPGAPCDTHTPAEWVGFDGYHFTDGDFAAAREAGARVLAIEDGPRLEHYDVDLLLDCRPGADEREYHIAPTALCLTGSKYAPLRDEILCLPRRSRHPARATRVLVSLGGSDPTAATLIVIAALRLLGMPTLEARIVVGPANPRRAQIEAAAAGDARLSVVAPTPCTMRGLFGWAELAVVAAGGTCWELAYLGVPAAAIAVADNQAGALAAWARRGAIVSLGRRERLSPAELAETVGGLIRGAPRRRRLAERGQSLIDGRGADRVVRAMLWHGHLGHVDADLRPRGGKTLCGATHFHPRAGSPCYTEAPT
jgi:UDP-2,4-diacetamido-2,4,6-trideoxy-beta-L-altropyranose hydrolase